MAGATAVEEAVAGAAVVGLAAESAALTAAEGSATFGTPDEAA